MPPTSNNGQSTPTNNSCPTTAAGPQVWRERLLPRLERHLADRLDSVASYQLLYHEAALANLLEVCRRALLCQRGTVAGCMGAGRLSILCACGLPTLPRRTWPAPRNQINMPYAHPAGAAVPQGRLRGCGGGGAHRAVRLVSAHPCMPTLACNSLALCAHKMQRACHCDTACRCARAVAYLTSDAHAHAAWKGEGSATGHDTAAGPQRQVCCCCQAHGIGIEQPHYWSHREITLSS